MILHEVFRQLLASYPHDVPQPAHGGSAPPELNTAVEVGLNLLAWAGTAAGVIGVLATGTVMAISHRRGEASEHMSRLGIVLAGCVLVATAGPIISWFFNGGSDSSGTTPPPVIPTVQNAPK